LAILKPLEHWRRLPNLLYVPLFIPPLYLTKPFYPNIQNTLLHCLLLPKKESDQRTPQWEVKFRVLGEHVREQRWKRLEAKTGLTDEIMHLNIFNLRDYLVPFVFYYLYPTFKWRIRISCLRQMSVHSSSAPRNPASWRKLPIIKGILIRSWHWRISRTKWVNRMKYSDRSSRCWTWQQIPTRTFKWRLWRP
jgi:hypothetical protein